MHTMCCSLSGVSSTSKDLVFALGFCFVQLWSLLESSVDILDREYLRSTHGSTNTSHAFLHLLPRQTEAILQTRPWQTLVCFSLMRS